ncbi:7558_t:CDS:2, partial [Funneliformis geosporum]
MVSAHLLTSIHIDEEFIEVLCAVIYLNPNPWRRPSSGFVGFLRVLEFLVEWEGSVVIGTSSTNTVENGTNVNDETIKKSVFDKLLEKFKNTRANGNFKHSTMFLATINTMSNEGVIWGEEKPSKVVAIRIKELAKAAIECVDEIINGKVVGDKGFKRLFVTPLQDFDVIIHLNLSVCTRYYQNLDPDKSYFIRDKDHRENEKREEILKLFELEAGISEKRNIEVDDKEKNEQSNEEDENESEEKWPIIGFDPVECYINELEKVYSDTSSLLFFYDKYGGTFIGLVWNPTNFIPKTWKVNIGFSSIPVDLISNEERDKVLVKKGEPKKQPTQNGEKIYSNKVIINTKAIVLEIERL